MIKGNRKVTLSFTECLPEIVKIDKFTLSGTHPGNLSSKNINKFERLKIKYINRKSTKDINETELDDIPLNTEIITDYKIIYENNFSYISLDNFLVFYFSYNI